MRKEVDFVGYGAGEVGEGLADIGGIVVGFIAVLRCDAEELLVDSFEGVDTFLKLNVIGRELGLVKALMLACGTGEIAVGEGAMQKEA